MRHDACELAGNGTVYVLHNGEVGWEKYIKVALMDLLVVSLSVSKIPFWAEIARTENGLTRGVVTGTVRLLYLV